MTYNELLTIIAESAQLNTEMSVVRSFESELYPLLSVPKPLKAITGLRRSGKSYLLKKMYRHLIDKMGVPQSNILFVNFENDRLVKYCNLIGLRNLFDIFISHTSGQKPIYLFLDEIQNVHQWESFVRTIYDSTNYNIFITGSNSHLLSSEFSTSLGGRILEFNIYPFSFKEYIEWNNIPDFSNTVRD
ncbi:MAG: AAA family ATPase [Patescibacteria group bacterium]